MLASTDIPLFLNESFVDELWVRFKREGLPTAQVQEFTQTLAAKAKLSGFGKIWDLLLPDITAELGADAGRKRSETVAHNSMLRALLLPELIPNLVELPPATDSAASIDMDVGTFVRIACDNVALTPLPSLASFLRQTMVEGLDVERQDLLARQ